MTRALDAVKLGLLVLVTAVLQASIVGAFDIGGGRPDLLLVTVVVVALQRGTTSGAVTGFAAGLVFDLATFETPTRALRCAFGLNAALEEIGLGIRTAIHTGEIELMGDDVGGIAVHIGARVSALAGSGEVLVSSTVKDLVAGSGIDFEDRGAHALKGVPGEWRLFAVERA